MNDNLRKWRNSRLRTVRLLEKQHSQFTNKIIIIEKLLKNQIERKKKDNLK